VNTLWNNPIQVSIAYSNRKTSYHSWRKQLLSSVVAEPNRSTSRCSTKEVREYILLKKTWRARIKRSCQDISVCRKLCNPWHSFLRLPHVPFVWGIRKFNPIAPQLPKIEAIQTSLFVDVLNAFPAMTGPLPAAIRSRIVRLLLLHWQPLAIVEEVHCCSRTVYSILENIFMYSSPFKPQFRPKGAPRKVFKAAENGLIAYHEDQP